MEESRFVVDLNVGRLAKWLRVLGYDALFPADAEDNELLVSPFGRAGSSSLETPDWRCGIWRPLDV